MSKNKKALSLTIPEPCGENFNKMVPVKGGKFCGSCEKTIVDFRQMNDRQIIRFYEKSDHKICGVFLPNQLNRAIPFPMERTLSRNWKAIAALASGLLLTGGLMAQTTSLNQPTPVVQTIVKGETVVNEVDHASSPSKLLKGFIKSSTDKEPLIGATILIKGMEIGAISDFDGFFELAIPADIEEMEVTISYTGYESQTILFNQQYPLPSQEITVAMNAEMIPWEEPMIMGMIIAETGEKGTCEAGDNAFIEEIPEIEPDLKINKATALDITVYPNPFTNQFKVDFEYKTDGDYLFHLYDMNGSLIYAKTYTLLKGKQTVDLDMNHQNLINGMYILQISDRQDRILASKKISNL